MASTPTGASGGGSAVTGRGDEPSVASRVLLDLFRSCRGQDILFIEPGGNHGDRLIYLGAEKLARVAGVTFRTATSESFSGTCSPDCDVIYIHGCGGINPWCSGRVTRAVLQAAHVAEVPVIVGPQTVHNDAAFLRHVLGDPLRSLQPKRMVVMARDAVSESALRDCVPGWVEIVSDHDTALNLAPEDLGGSGAGRGALYVLRRDSETPDAAAIPRLVFSIDPALACETFEQWAAVHARARIVVSNRLHSAIAGAVLGKETYLVRGSYHKNRSVWEYSLRERGVRWADEAPVMPVASLSTAAEIIRHLSVRRFSRRVARRLRWVASQSVARMARR